MAKTDGIWRTISGRRIFIAEGQSLSEAISKSEKFKTKSNKITEVVKSRLQKHKQSQLDIIQKTNSMQDEYHTGIRKIEDIKTFAEALKDEDNIVTAPDYSLEQAKQALADGEITIYSSKPIENGAFVTPSQMEAAHYASGDKDKLYSKKVKLNEVAWIDNYEGQYAKVDDSNTRIKSKSKNFDIDETRSNNYWKDIGGKPANKVTFGEKNGDGHITIMEKGDGSNSIFETYVKPEKRNQGLGTTLLQKAIDKYGSNNLSGQFSSDQSVKNAYKLGFRNDKMKDLDSLLAKRQKDSSVYMEYKKKKGGK